MACCVDEKRRTSNNCDVAQRVKREVVGYLQPSNYIAAIDFGVTNCSVAYILPGDKADIKPSLLPFDGTYYRVPTAIVFNLDGSVKAFGTAARRAYSKLDDSKRMNCAFFDQIKMNLQHDETVNREFKVEASNGKIYYLIEVIAHILKYLKDYLILRLRKSGLYVSATDFDWVITVPAIWKARGKQMMREAGYKAGLCSRESCPKLVEACNSDLMKKVMEQNPEKLSLALKPESAAIFCHYSSQKQSSSKESSFSYLVVDIGAETVDISAHSLEKRSEPYMKELIPATGNDCGGTRVNEEFKTFLQNIVKDEGFRKYFSAENGNRNRLNLDKVIKEEFEKEKQIFGSDPNNYNGIIELPSLFVEIYKHYIQESSHESEYWFSSEDQEIILSRELMCSFFDKTVKGIIKCIGEALSRVHVDYIYLVGGFGGCKYIAGKVAKVFDWDKCFVPMEPAHAVVRGAALFKTNPRMVKFRKADATYGIKSSILFEKGLHDPSYQITSKDGNLYCKNIFQTVVQKDDVIGPDEVYTITCVPFHHDQTSMLFQFYSSQGKDLFYITGESRTLKQIHKVTKIGEITIEMPDLRGDKDRQVEVMFSFSNTEIQVTAHDKTSHERVNIVLDFLTK